METNKKNAGPVKTQPQAQKPAVVTPHPKQPALAKPGDYAFNKDNYKLMLIGLALIILGFILMIGGGSNDPAVFNPAIFDFQRLTLSPLLIIAGYIVEIFAIMKKPKD
jgi:hypothetical protein